MKKFATLALCAVMVVVAFATIPSASAVTITNAGFEDGNLNGWWSGGGYSWYRSVRTSHYTGYSAYTWVTPADGNYFLRLQGNYPSYVNYYNWYSGYSQITSVRQIIFANAGETIGGSAAFEANDYMPYNDRAWVRIRAYPSLSVIAQPWYKSLSMVPYYGYSGWESWSYTFGSTGLFVLEYAAANLYDTIGDPYGFFDAAAGPPKFPELVVVDSGVSPGDVSAGGLFQAFVIVENIGEKEAEVSSIEWAGDCVYSQAMPNEPKTIAVGEQATFGCWGVPSPDLETGDTCEVEFACHYNSESGDPCEETVDIAILNRRLGGVRADYSHCQDAAFHGLALTMVVADGSLPEGGSYLADGNQHFMDGEWKAAKNDYVKCPGSPGLGNTCGGRGAFFGDEGNSGK
jgi:hypothetical protein